MKLTPSQQEAVEHEAGPLLVLAGPGSGKTRVITQRIARLIERGVCPWEILAITFTNKSAGEMAARVAAASPGNRVWVSTFHRFCARLLRQYGASVGLESGFSIYDTTDQQQMIRQVLHDLDIDAVHCPPGKISARISRAKNDLQTPERFVERYEESVGDYLQAVTARVYPEYQRLLLRSNAVDFDDLLLHVVTLLSENPELRRKLDERYRFVLVDEYQDTNLPQYRIVAALSQDVPNLCATGDPDQSIYGWRGARIDNILRFEADFPTARVIRLEENFRSTKQILRSADRLIARNVYRKAKRLTTENAEGTPVELLLFADGRQEADGIAQKMREQVESGERKWSDFAVFYRVNALSREMELAFTRQRIPYQVAAGVAFYERAEIKDMLAYLRLIQNPTDRAAFLRVVNTPLRGIGKTTQQKLAEWADAAGINLLEAAARADEVPKLSQRAAKKLQGFERLVSGFSFAESGSVAELLTHVISTTGYTREWQDNPSEQEAQRLANVNELVTAAHQYDEAMADERSLEGFLESASLAGDVDNLDETAGAVTLMTLHAAKGLEFPVVYILAVEENLIPHERALRTGGPRQIEEERRLLFVGMTRAMEQLYLTNTMSRELRGRPLHSIPSEFLADAQLVPSGVPAPHFAGQDELPAFSSFRGSSAEFSWLPGSRPLGGSLLTTGAALLNGSGESADIPLGFAVGMTVRHPQYGLGTVVQVEGFAKRRTLTVEFREANRSQTFVASKCPLQPVGIR